MSSSTRGWVTVNVFWLIQKGLEEVRLVPPDTKQTIELCPTASSLHKKLQTDKVPPPVHVSPLYENFCLLYRGNYFSRKLKLFPGPEIKLFPSLNNEKEIIPFDFFYFLAL